MKIMWGENLFFKKAGQKRGVLVFLNKSTFFEIQKETR
ncbi:hypothetical protein IGM_04747 [Bacillus cereus HuB4-4]|uniref:Uncharacterized protein n=1 Tax=Bacillus cereus HuB4-4 TaxID=1053211 RepID=A0A9W5VJS8_BACCE|nr:hypothetical protein IGM_06671 [Bacillus cereus HuB4-4]EOP83858.1 hypothetical protein IGM_04747 [Bacillus cereus HuB4-4]